MKKSKMVVKFENFLKNLTYLYKISLLEWIRKKRKTITIFLLGTLALTIFFLTLQKKN